MPIDFKELLAKFPFIKEKCCAITSPHKGLEDAISGRGIVVGLVTTIM